MNDERLLTLAADLAWQAASVILGLRARGFATSTKPDASPVTEADQASERLLAQGFRAATPEIEVVAEEEISAGYQPRGCEAYWLVDPLDGTRDFVANRDGFTVNVGLVRDGKPVLGVVAEPAAATLFGGIVGLGAWKQDAAGRRPIHVRPPPVTGLVVLSSRHTAHDSDLTHLLAGRHVASVSQLGSALKFCRIAEAKADFYARFGRTMEWDTAGPHAVLQAAGGMLTRLDGGALAYGKPNWANPPFVASCGI
jgi:3'(2'), 5'-bisphosphate nucleotidase